MTGLPANLVKSHVKKDQLKFKKPSETQN